MTAKGRAFTIIVVIVVLGLLGWIGSNLRFKETTRPLPLRGEARTNPFYAAIQLAEELGADAAWERVFTEPRNDSVLMLSGWSWDLSRTRRARLEQWVESGGRLIMDDSMIGGQDEFEKWTGIGTSYDDDRPVDESDPIESDSIDGEPEVEEPADGKSPRKPVRKRLNEGERFLIKKLIGNDCSQLTEDGTRREYTVCGIEPGSQLVSSRPITWALREGRRIQAVRVAVGRGSVTVINGSPFRFRSFLEGEHPLLFVTATQLHRGDSLLFLTEEEHAGLLTLMWRFGAPVMLLVAALIALSLWRASTRFGPLSAPLEKSRRSLAEQIRGSGQFTLRFGGGRALHAALVRAVREAAIRRVPSWDRLSGEERVTTLAKLTGVLESELGPAMNYSGTRSSHELRNVIAVLETARRRLSKEKHGN